MPSKGNGVFLTTVTNQIQGLNLKEKRIQVSTLTQVVKSANTVVHCTYIIKSVFGNYDVIFMTRQYLTAFNFFRGMNLCVHEQRFWDNAISRDIKVWIEHRKILACW